MLTELKTEASDFYMALPYIFISTEYTECWPCPLFDILLNKFYPAGLSGGR
jgi:hypothetical protein